MPSHIEHPSAQPGHRHDTSVKYKHTPSAPNEFISIVIFMHSFLPSFLVQRITQFDIECHELSLIVQTMHLNARKPGIRVTTPSHCLSCSGQNSLSMFAPPSGLKFSASMLPVTARCHRGLGSLGRAGSATGGRTRRSATSWSHSDLHWGGKQALLQF